MTYTSINPEAAQAFVEKFMGVAPKPVYYSSDEQSECADVRFNALCQDKDYNLHFVNGHTYPMGPMSTHDLYTYAEHVLFPMDKWNDFMQPATGFLVRNLTLVWEGFKNAGHNIWLTKTDENGPYTIWAALPGGIVYTYTSFILDPQITRLAVHFRRPCDPPPEKVYRFQVEESDSWKNHSWPIQHSFMPWYSNIPVYDTEAEAQRFLEILNGHGITTRKQEGCIAIKMQLSEIELRFETVARMNRTRTKAFPYLFEDFMSYLARIHTSLEWFEYNAWADYHQVVQVGQMTEPYTNFLDLELRLQQLGLPYFKKSRSGLDSFIVSSRDRTAVFQFKFVNLDLKHYLSTDLDTRIPMCEEQESVGAAEMYDWYSDVAKSGITAQAMTFYSYNHGWPGSTEVLGVTPPHFENEELLGTPFDFCTGPSKRFDTYFESSFDCLYLDNLKLCAPP